MSPEISMPDNVPNMRMGAGFNTLSQMPLDLVMDATGEYDVIGDASAGTGEMTADIIESRTDLCQLLGINGSTQLGIGSFAASADVEKLDKLKFNSYSLFYYIRRTYSSQQEVLKRYNFVENVAQYINQPEVFFRFAGDEFISSRRLGGEFIAIVKLETSSSTEYSSLKSDFRASFKNALGVSRGSASVSSAHEVNETIKRQKGTYMFFKRGGSEHLPSWDIEEIRDSFLSFGEEVSGSRYPFKVSTMPYKSLIAYANAGAYDIAGASQVIRRISKFFIETIERLDTVQYILKNLAEFVNPDIDYLLKLESKLTAAINLMRSTIQVCIKSPRDNEKCKLLNFEEMYSPADMHLPIRLSGKYKRGQGPVCGIEDYEKMSIYRSCRCPENGPEVIETRFFNQKVRSSNKDKRLIEQESQKVNSSPSSYISTDPASQGFGYGWKFLKVEVTENRIEEKVGSEKKCRTVTPRGNRHNTDLEPYEVCQDVPYTYYDLIAQVRVHFALEAWKDGPNPACGVDFVPDPNKPIYKSCEHPSFGVEP